MVNMVEFFDSGLQRLPSRDEPLFGRRPVLSRNPLKLANYFEWISWDTVDHRRRYVGSGLRKLFNDGVGKSGELDIVGIYSGNCPGELTQYAVESRGDKTKFTGLGMQNGRSWTWAYKHTALCRFVCMTRWAKIPQACSFLNFTHRIRELIIVILRIYVCSA